MGGFGDQLMVYWPAVAGGLAVLSVGFGVLALLKQPLRLRFWLRGPWLPRRLPPVLEVRRRNSCAVSRHNRYRERNCFHLCQGEWGYHDFHGQLSFLRRVSWTASQKHCDPRSIVWT